MKSGIKIFRHTRELLEKKLTHNTREEPALKQSRRWRHSVTWCLISATGFSIAWLSFARTEEIAVVSGKLEPVGQVQEIRMPVGGVAKVVLVKEGEFVKAGQILLELDIEATTARSVSIKQSIKLKQQQIEEKDKEILYYQQLNSTEQQTLDNNIRLQQDIVTRLDVLRRQGAAAEIQFLQERNRLGESRGRLKQTQVDRQRQQSILNQQQQQQGSELAQLRSQLSEQKITLRYQVIRSPVDGMVFDLKPKGQGYVAQTSETIVKVVPQGNLQAVIEIPSKQIGFVHIGQKAEINIDSYPANDFGVLQGEVTRVSSDALPPDPNKPQSEYRYPGVVRLSRQSLKLQNGEQLSLQAGMSLSAHIKLRSSTYLQLLLGSFRNRADSIRKIP